MESLLFWRDLDYTILSLLIRNLPNLPLRLNNIISLYVLGHSQYKKILKNSFLNSFGVRESCRILVGYDPKARVLLNVSFGVL